MRKIQTLKALKASRKVTEGFVKLGQNFTMRSFTAYKLDKVLENNMCTSWEQKSSKAGEQLCLYTRHEGNGGRL